MSSVTFVPADPTGRFQFHANDGAEIVVEQPFTTDDPSLIAYLDDSPAVKRADEKAKG